MSSHETNEGSSSSTGPGNIVSTSITSGHYEDVPVVDTSEDEDEVLEEEVVEEEEPGSGSEHYEEEEIIEESASSALDDEEIDEILKEAEDIMQKDEAAAAADAATQVADNTTAGAGLPIVHEEGVEVQVVDGQAAPRVFAPPPLATSRGIMSMEEEDPSDEMMHRTADEAPTVANAAPPTSGVVDNSGALDVGKSSSHHSRNSSLRGNNSQHSAASSSHRSRGSSHRMDSGGPGGVIPVETVEDASSSHRSAPHHDVSESEVDVSEASEHNASNRGGGRATAAAVMAGNADDDDEVEDDLTDENVGEDATTDVEAAMEASPQVEPPSIKDKAAAAAANENDRKRRGGWMLLLAALLCLGVIAAAVAIPLALVDKDDDDGDRGLNDDNLDGSPTSAPTFSFVDYAQTADVAFPIEGMGSSVALSGDYMLVSGADIGPGVVAIYESAGNNSWTPQSTLQGAQDGERFGASVDITQGAATPGMLVGAPEAFAVGTPSSAGAAAYYEYSRADNSWNMVGESMSSGLDAANANEQFGASVATSDNYRVAAGAPRNNAVALGAGRVYTYELAQDGNTFTWQPMQDPLEGTVAGESFGYAVDIAPSGNLMIAGSPQLDIFRLYNWTGDSWESIYAGNAPAESRGELFGSSVAILSDRFLAVGGPEAENGKGVVRLYGLSDTGFFKLIGEPIYGESLSSGIGDRGTISGFEDTEGNPVAFISDKDGGVRRYDYDSDDNAFRLEYDALDTGLTSVSALSSAGSAVMAAAVDDSRVVVFDTVRATGSGETPGIDPGAGGNSGDDDGATGDDASTGATAAPATSEASSPTASPVALDLSNAQWELASPAFDGPTSHGRSVAASANVVAAGAPGFGSDGAVQTYQKGNDGVWSALSTLSPEDAGGAFGTAVDLGTMANVLVVGAPTVADATTGQSFGAAYVYFLNSNGQTWTKVGDTLRPAVDVGEVNGQYGAAGSISANGQRVAIGAPGTNLVSNGGVAQAGRVYVYELVNNNWQPMGDAVDGPGANVALGSSVDLSSDGTRMVVGGNNVAAVYSWTGSAWNNDYVVTGTDSFGASVAFLNADGSRFAAASGGSIAIYTATGGSYAQLGSNIEVGASAVVAGADDNVLIGTASGDVSRYAFDGTDWNLVADVVSTGAAGVNAISVVGGSANAFAAGTSNDAVSVYQLTSSSS